MRNNQFCFNVEIGTFKYLMGTTSKICPIRFYHTCDHSEVIAEIIKLQYSKVKTQNSDIVQIISYCPESGK